MTDLKTLATKFNLTQKRIKEISVILFGSELTEFDDDQVLKIQANIIASTAKNEGEVLGLVQAIEKKIEPTQANNSENPLVKMVDNYKSVLSNAEQFHQIKELIGNRTITRNAENWQLELQKTFVQYVDMQEAMMIALQLKSAQLFKDTFQNLIEDARESVVIANIRHDDFIAGFLSEEKEKLDKLVRGLEQMDVENSVKDSVAEQRLKEAVNRLIKIRSK